MNIAGGSCIPMWILALLAINLRRILSDAIILGAANANADSITDMYRDAIREITEVIHSARTAPALEIPEQGHCLRLEALASLAEHAEILQAFVGADRHRARFFGLVATMGLARTLAVTLFTVLLGLWTILRGANVRFVADVACPN